jgi:hypothetical protein
MSIARFCTALMRIEPTVKMTQAIESESRRPKRSPVHEATKEPRREPPAMAAVMPPCVTEPGLLK